METSLAAPLKVVFFFFSLLSDISELCNEVNHISLEINTSSITIKVVFQGVIPGYGNIWTSSSWGF